MLRSLRSQKNIEDIGIVITLFEKLEKSSDFEFYIICKAKYD